MLASIRRVSGTWLGKAVLVVVFGILIVSFAIWGIGDIFRGYGAQTVAKVGSTEIGLETMRRQFQTRIQQEQQRQPRFTAEQARLIGLDRRVLNELIAESALTQEAARLGLNIAPEDVARQLATEPAFRGLDGRFSRAALDAYLREVGLSEQGFLSQQRQVLMRQHVAEALTGGATAPDALMRFIHRYRSEERTIRSLVIPGTIAASLALPEETVLRALHTERRTLFRAPEYRAASLLILEPAEFISEIVVTDADLRAAYDSGLTQGRFGTPERRRVQQILFPNAADAASASARLKSGLTFDALLEEMKLKPEDVDLGLKSRGELIDRAVAAAAFGLAKDAISDPVAGQFGTVLLRVTEIAASEAQPFEAARETVRSDLIAQRLQSDRGIRAKVDQLHDRIEDLRSQGKTLEQVAQELKRALLQVDSTDAQGITKSGEPLATALKTPIPDQADVLRALFQSDRGVDNEAIRTRQNGYVWFEVSRVEPARERGYDEVKDQVADLWRRDEANRRSAANANDLLKRFEGGEALEAIAQELGGQIETTTGLRREGQSPLGPSAVATAFALPVKGKGVAATGMGSDRLLLEVMESMVPQYVASAPDVTSLKGQLDRALRNDILDQYVTLVQNRLKVVINERALAQATGASTGP